MYTLPLKFLNASAPANFTERLCFENKTVVLNVLHFSCYMDFISFLTAPFPLAQKIEIHSILYQLILSVTLHCSFIVRGSGSQKAGNKDSAVIVFCDDKAATPGFAWPRS